MVVAAPVFVAGYLLYGLWFAAAGATVARPEDARSAAVSVIPIMVLGYIATIGTLGTGQDTSLLRVLTFVPWTAPFAILMRAGIQTLTGWQAALAGAEIVLAIAISASLAARIYRNSILRTGKRTPVLAAIRA